MVTAKTQYQLKNAKGYFKEHLSVGDYYKQGQTVAGEWFGEGAQRLGLTGNIRAADFLRLCENRDPSTGTRLTVRLKTTRVEDGRVAANRRIFYDFTFSPPKSVSLVAMLGGEERIALAHARAVRTALGAFEGFAATRLRQGNQQGDRFTGNMVAALFTHETSRALDPHLHTHCIVFNATFDQVEDRWKALQNHPMLRARKFVEQAYYHELARELRRFGYGIRNRPEGDFQLEGVSQELCDRFSKRDAQIDAALKKLLAEKPELQSANVGKLRQHLATVARDRKQKDVTRQDLRQLWDGQTTAAERDLLHSLRSETTLMPTEGSTVKLTDAVQWAEEHLFERHSVVLENQIWQEALRRARGESFALPELIQMTRERDYLRPKDGLGEVTTRDVLQREWQIVSWVREGIGACGPLLVPFQEGIAGADHRPNSTATHESGVVPARQLDDEQRRALSELMRSTNVVSLFRGGAGTGKSYVLRALVESAVEMGRRTLILAPQRQQVVDMEHNGFPGPTTVAAFLQRRDLAVGAIVVVDEAGQIGGKQMIDLLALIRERQARLVLSGDTRQHGPVEASDALIAIERYSGIRPVQLNSIRRQDPRLGKVVEERKRIRAYRQAVSLAAAGKLAESFAKLEKLGAVTECRLGEQADKLAMEYVGAVKEGASTVVVSQTWAEVHRINERVRLALKEGGLLGAIDTPVTVLEKVDLTLAQKRDPACYPSGAVVVLNRKLRRAEPGAQGKLVGVLKSGVLVEIEGRYISVANRWLDRLTVCVPRSIPVAAGERLQIKANRQLGSGQKLTNGELVTAQAVSADGTILLTDGRTLGPAHREFLPGYAVTSYGSQGKTVDYVLFSDSSNRAATNAQQWYVSISRGRRGIRIFTSDKEQLRENLHRSGERPLAIDLAHSLAGTGAAVRWPVRRQGLHACLLRFGEWAAGLMSRTKPIHLRRVVHNTTPHHEHQTTRMLRHRSQRPGHQGRIVP